MMDFDLNILAVVLPFIFIGGFVDSIAGGGGIVTMIGFMMANVPMQFAMGTNKIQSLFGTGISTFNYVRNNHYKKEFIIFSVIGTIIGSSIGANIAILIDQQKLKFMMSAIIPIIALILLTNKKPKFALTDSNKKHIYIITFFIGLLIGFYDGLLGPGTGTFLIIAFSMCGLSLLNANGSAKVVNLASNITAGTMFVLNGKVIFWLVIPCIIVNVIANYLGSHLAIKNGDKIVKPIIIGVLILLFVKLLYDVII